MRYLLFLFFHPSLPLYRFFLPPSSSSGNFIIPSSSPPFPFYRPNKITNYACRKEGERRVGKTVANISQCPNQQNVYSQGEMYRNSLFAKYGGYERLFYQGEKCFYLSGAAAVYVGRGREHEDFFSVYNEERERQKKVLLVAFGRDCMACLGTKNDFHLWKWCSGKRWVEAGGKKSYYSFFLPHTTQQVGVAKADRGADCRRSFFWPPLSCESVKFANSGFAHPLNSFDIGLKMANSCACVSGAVIAVDAFAAGAQPKPVTATSQICLWKEKETQFLSLCRYAKTASDVCHFSRKKDKKKTEQQSGKHSSQEATTTEISFLSSWLLSILLLPFSPTSARKKICGVIFCFPLILGGMDMSNVMLPKLFSNRKCWGKLVKFPSIFNFLLRFYAGISARLLEKSAWKKISPRPCSRSGQHQRKFFFPTKNTGKNEASVIFRNRRHFCGFFSFCGGFQKKER